MTTNSGSTSTPTVVIVGAGAAGIFTAYQINKQFPGKFDVQLFEASNVIGGNVSSLSVQYGGQTYTIDAGAQFFYANAQPNYLKLIHELGLDKQVKLFPTGITIWERSTNQRLFWIPSDVLGFFRYDKADVERMGEFIVFMVEATKLNAGQPDWTLSVDDWLAGVDVSDAFKQNVIKNFFYQFVSLPYDKIGESSALYATTYFVRNFFGGPPVAKAAGDSPTFISTFQTNQSLIGLLGILEKALSASGVSAKTSSPVTAVAPGANGVAVTVGGNTINAKYVVLACDPGTAGELLTNGRTAQQDLIDLMEGMGKQYLRLSIVMQKDGACWMPGDQSYWEGVSTLVDTPKKSVAFNAWFGPLRPTYGKKQQIPVFKSWGAPDLQSAGCANAFFSHVHNVMLPTTTFMQLRSHLNDYQNRNGLMFAGGWTDWFDSQEAALMSAMKVAQMLQPSGEMRQASQPADAYDPGALAGQVKSWIEMVLQHIPEPYKPDLAEVVNQLG
jgi:predicted NAD/FAD-binding protein